MFVVFEFRSVKKWASVIENITIEHLTEVALKKFPEIGHNKINFTDVNKIIIDDDYLNNYITDNKYINIEIGEDDSCGPDQTQFISPVDTPANTSSVSTLSINDSDIQQTDNIQFPIVWNVVTDPNLLESTSKQSKKVVTKRGYNITSQELRELLEERNSSIFEEYNQIGCLTTQKRKILVNVVVDIMIERYGHSIPTHVKEDFAQAIIEIFPKLKDPFSPKGYETFFNPERHDGFLSWRLKTVIRNNPEKKQRGEKRKLQNENQPTSSKIARNDEIETAIQTMKVSNPKTDRNTIFKNMQLTFAYRRQNLDSIIENFPRIIDTEGLIEQEFSLLHPNRPTLAECFPSEIEKVLNIYKNTVQNPSTDILPVQSDDEEIYCQELRAILALQQMLPPTTHGRKSSGRQSAAGAVDKFIVFKKTNIPLEQAVKGACQPYIIAEGPFKSQLTCFHICVDGKLISTPKEITPLEAVDLLFMTHFVFDTKYDVSLHSFWSFIQSYYYKIDDVQYTPKMRELRSKLV